jgi:alpha-2-macroglobulin
VSAPGIESTQRLTLTPGVSFVGQPMRGAKADGVVRVTLQEKGAVVDSLETPFKRIPARWTNPQTLVVDLAGASTPIALPPDAGDVRLRFAASASAHFSRVVDDLLDYPYGCIEQTSSRMIPFALAIESLGPGAGDLADRLRQQLNGQRVRLAYMATPRSLFSWWGQGGAEDPFLTAYAYYADWRAARALGISRESDHWSRLLDVYSESASTLPLFHRALMLHWMAEMKLPVKGLVEGLQTQLAAEPVGSVPRRRLSRFDSRVLVDPRDRLGHAFAVALVDALAPRLGVERSAALLKQTDTAYAVLGASGTPAAEALLIANKRMPAAETARVLRGVTAEMPTIERALTLTWLDGALRGDGAGTSQAPTPEAPWRAIETRGGSVQWLWPAGQPLPGELRVSAPPAHATAAVVQFDSASSPDEALEARLERHLYRVTKNGDGHELTPLGPGTPLLTDELYVDEIRLVPNGRPVRHAVIEVPLPPGASVESTTWGINLRNASGDFEGLERARHEPTPYGYAVPVENASSELTLRHLVRLAEKGSFVVPAARAYRMYQPEAKALEDGGWGRWEVR